MKFKLDISKRYALKNCNLQKKSKAEEKYEDGLS